MWRNLGYIPNIRNPSTFNEKIAHRKLYAWDRKFTELADKWVVRDYVKSRVGEEYLTEVYQHITNIKDLDFEALPESFVAKGRHDSGSVMLIDHKSREDVQLLRERFEQILRRRISPTYHEYWYAGIPAGIIIEERLRDENHFVPLDFKFLVFHGRVEFIQVFHDRHIRTSVRFYDRAWNPLSVGRPGMPLAPVIQRPRQLAHMIAVAETLADDLDFVRVDLYAPSDRRVVFGELTFAPASGRRPFVPRSFDWELGRYW